MNSTVFDVATYILKNKAPMSAMKLQKLIFYSQAMALVWDDIPLFDDDFEAWVNGPVCPALYDKHRGHYIITSDDFFISEQPDINRIEKDHKDTIDTVLESLADYSPYELSEMTHREDPWKNARKGLSPSMYSNNIITKEIMANYYRENW